MMLPLRVVVVTTDAPDPFGPTMGRWHYVLLKGLAERGHRVTCFSAYTREVQADRARSRLASLGITLRLYPYPDRGNWLKAKIETLRQPYSYFISEPLRRDLDATLRQGYDVLHLEEMWVGYLGLGRPKTLLSVYYLASIDLRERGMLPLKGWLTTRLMVCTERWLARQFRYIRVPTKPLEDEIRRLNGTANIVTIPFAIDPALYEFCPERRDGCVVGLIASMGWMPGYTAAVRLLTAIWPKVKRRVNGARLLIAGWEARRRLTPFLNLPDVTILEDLEDPRTFYDAVSVLAHPLSLGSGVRVKILEAMAYGVPVVTTHEGIVGIEAINGRHAWIEDDDETFADKIVQLLINPSFRETMAKESRWLLEMRYSPSPVLTEIEQMYEMIGRG